MQKIEIMLKLFVKHYSFYLLFCLICNTTIAQTKQSTFIIDEWAFSNLIKPNSNSFKFYQNKLTKFVPKGFKIDLLFKGHLSSDKMYDFCIILKKVNKKDSTYDLATNERPLIIIINNKFIFRNNNIVSPLYVTKGTRGIVMKKGILYILSLICSEAGNECLFAEIFKYNNHNKIIFDKCSEFRKTTNIWVKIKGNEKKGMQFEEYNNNW